MGRCCSEVNLVQCDKAGRLCSDDPCSECRWFAGGPASKCTLILNSSLNDHCWNTMMIRGNQGYTLPEPRPKDEAKQVSAKVLDDLARRQREAREKGGRSRPLGPPKTSSPMNGVKLGWKGETKDELLAKPYPLPPPVRAHPRAYLVPPRPSSALQNSRTYHGALTQRDGEHEQDDGAFPALPPALNAAPSPLQQFPPPITSMPTDAFGRQAIRCMWDDTSKTWTNCHANGAVTVSASYNVGLLSQLPILVPKTVSTLHC